MEGAANNVFLNYVWNAPKDFFIILKIIHVKYAIINVCHVRLSIVIAVVATYNLIDLICQDKMENALAFKTTLI